MREGGWGERGDGVKEERGGRGGRKREGGREFPVILSSYCPTTPRQNVIIIQWNLSPPTPPRTPLYTVEPTIPIP